MKSGGKQAMIFKIRSIHMSKTERVFCVTHVTNDHHRLYSPPRINLFEDHGDVVDDHPQFPQNVSYGSPPKERLKGAPLNSADRMKPSPVSRNNDHSNTDGSDDDNYDRQVDMECPTRLRWNVLNPNMTLIMVGNPRKMPYSAPVSSSPKNDVHYKTANIRPIRLGLLRSKPETDTGYASNPPKASGNPSFSSPNGRKPHHTFPAKDLRYEMEKYVVRDNGKDKKTFDNRKPIYAQQPLLGPHPMAQPRNEDLQETIYSNKDLKH
ncbi:Hypothetical predicted protein [Olea europaea subsp. europaea]|uniref:Uncharacterized protein n=1 Tax=Olea europaea subsp. europaea TaxID=158383 RepID=A0A8S0VLA6_OLEEU|nr:Hypothetical predicted protein [Olea europaea subsp. europaea]